MSHLCISRVVCVVAQPLASFYHIFVLLLFSFSVASAPSQFGEANVKHGSELSDDDPLYDSVASDEDYVTAEQLAKCLKVAVCIEDFVYVYLINCFVTETLS